MRTLLRTAAVIGATGWIAWAGAMPAQALDEGADPSRVVTPAPPEARPISGCGTYGYLGMLGTQGVSYRLTEGDGRQGRWEVQASAVPGYQLAGGVPTEWSGQLGTHVPCAAGSADTDSASPAADTASGGSADGGGEGLLSDRGERFVEMLALAMGGVALACGVILVVQDRQRQRIS